MSVPPWLGLARADASMAATSRTATSRAATSKGAESVEVTSAASAAGTLLAEALAAAKKEAAVHYVGLSVYTDQSFMAVGDATPTEGRQLITVHQGDHTGQVQYILVKKIVYLRGDAFGLTQNLGFTSAEAKKYAEKWISIVPADEEYSSFATILTLKDTLEQISIKGPYASKTVTVFGQTEISISGTTTNLSSNHVKSNATLFVSSPGTPLPVLFTGSTVVNRKKVTVSLAFSNWGESVLLSPPSKSIPATSVIG